MSLARQHQQRVLASIGGRTIASVGAAHPMPAGAANSPAPHRADTGPAATAYQLMLMKLAADRRRLKLIQSIERKIAVKREILPDYAAWVQGVLDGAKTGHGVQDEVLATVMVWRIDTGDYAGAMPLAAYVLRYEIALPEHYQRTPATLITEEIADGALKALTAGEAFPLEILLELEDLTGEADMPDEVKAKLHKAMGLELARLAANPDQVTAGAGSRSYQNKALAEFKRALTLNERCGVKKDVERLERELKKADANTQ